MGWPSRAFGSRTKKKPRTPIWAVGGARLLGAGDVRIVGGSQEISHQVTSNRTPHLDPWRTTWGSHQITAHRLSGSVCNRGPHTKPGTSQVSQLLELLWILERDKQSLSCITEPPNSGSRTAPVITGCNVSPQNLYAEVLTPRTSECGYTWRYGLQRGN